MHVTGLASLLIFYPNHTPPEARGFPVVYGAVLACPVLRRVYCYTFNIFPHPIYFMCPTQD